jgi:hypothetical protein
MYLLYESTIWLGKLMERNRAVREAAEEAAERAADAAAKPAPAAATSAGPSAAPPPPVDETDFNQTR